MRRPARHARRSNGNRLVPGVMGKACSFELVTDAAWLLCVRETGRRKSATTVYRVPTAMAIIAFGATTNRPFFRGPGARTAHRTDTSDPYGSLAKQPFPGGVFSGGQPTDKSLSQGDERVRGFGSSPDRMSLIIGSPGRIRTADQRINREAGPERIVSRRIKSKL
jgi:hypothetical protein